LYLSNKKIDLYTPSSYMILYLCLLDNIPYVIYTDKNKYLSSEFNKQLELVTLGVDFEEAPESLYVVVGEENFPNKHHIFRDIAEAINFADKHEIASLWEVAVNEFEDPNEFSLKSIFRTPLYFISGLELQYRMYNKLSAKEAFTEACGVWKMFCDTDYEIWLLLKSKYPDVYGEQFNEHIRQYAVLMKDSFTSREHAVSSLYA
jgi:RNAse (barnase) inhibitor barstar